MPRNPTLVRTVALLLLAGAVWYTSSSLLNFVGKPRAPGREASPVQRNGYRFDKMLEKGITSDLITAEGFWLGENGFKTAMNAKGVRYRMRPFLKEFKEDTEVENLLWQFGPIKMRLGEAFGGTANNPALRDIKRTIAKQGITDPAKLEENEYWIRRYGHKRWHCKNVDQSTGRGGFRLFRGLAAWSGWDPLREEKDVTWFEADYGKPAIAYKAGMRVPGWITKEQVAKEYASGKVEREDDAKLLNK